jgi:hypothetical protein
MVIGAVLGLSIPGGWMFADDSRLQRRRVSGLFALQRHNGSNRDLVSQRQRLYRLRVWSNRLEIDRAVSDLLDVRSGDCGSTKTGSNLPLP